MDECIVLWINETCHWAEEDPWRYCYSFSRTSESVNMIVEWLVKQRDLASQRAPTTSAIEVNMPVHDKVKRKIVNNMEEEQSCKL